MNTKLRTIFALPSGRLLRTFSGRLHRVLAYGDHVEPLKDLCRLLDIEVVSE
jgi:hypothetical protein